MNSSSTSRNLNSKSRIKRKTIHCIAENTELKAKLSRLTSEVNQLVADSIQRSSSCKQLQATLEDLNEAYDLLSAKNSQMMNAKAEETKKLLEKLQLTREELLQKKTTC